MPTSPKLIRQFVAKGDITRRVMDSYVPDFYRDNPRYEFAVKAMEILAPVFDYFLEKGDQLPDQLNTDMVSPEFLTSLAKLIGYEFDGTTSVGFQRKILPQMVDLFSKKGTSTLYERAIKRIATRDPYWRRIGLDGVVIQIIEGQSQIFFLDEITSKLSGAAKIQGYGNYIAGLVVIRTNVQLTEEDKQAILDEIHPAGIYLIFEIIGTSSYDQYGFLYDSLTDSDSPDFDVEETVLPGFKVDESVPLVYNILNTAVVSDLLLTSYSTINTQQVQLGFTDPDPSFVSVGSQDFSNDDYFLLVDFKVDENVMIGVTQIGNDDILPEHANFEVDREEFFGFLLDTITTSIDPNVDFDVDEVYILGGVGSFIEFSVGYAGDEGSPTTIPDRIPVKDHLEIEINGVKKVNIFVSETQVVGDAFE